MSPAARVLATLLSLLAAVGVFFLDRRLTAKRKEKAAGKEARQPAVPQAPPAAPRQPGRIARPHRLEKPKRAAAVSQPSANPPAASPALDGAESLRAVSLEKQRLEKEAQEKKEKAFQDSLRDGPLGAYQAERNSAVGRQMGDSAWRLISQGFYFGKQGTYNATYHAQRDVNFFMTLENAKTLLKEEFLDPGEKLEEVCHPGYAFLMAKSELRSLKLWATARVVWKKEAKGVFHMVPIFELDAAEASAENMEAIQRYTARMEAVLARAQALQPHEWDPPVKAKVIDTFSRHDGGYAEMLLTYKSGREVLGDVSNTWFVPLDVDYSDDQPNQACLEDYLNRVIQLKEA